MSAPGEPPATPGGAPAAVTPRLAQRLVGTAAAEPVDVVIELSGAPAATTGSRAERVVAARAAFDRDVDAVRRTVAAAGGTVLDAVWLNRTVRARVPARGVAAVAADERVAVVDLPRRIELDTPLP